jgi:hypothetical protein
LVNLQVVGLFYNASITATENNPIVKSLMGAAIVSPNSTGSVNGASAFNYGMHLDSPSATPTMSMITATYP